MKPIFLQLLCFLLWACAAKAQPVLYGVGSGGGANGSGVIFSFNPATASYAKRWDFQKATGRSPQGSLVQASDGKLYGMTFDGGAKNAGVIFSFDPVTATFAVASHFNGANGRTSVGNSLISASDGKLYGMTYLGGTHKLGVLFSFDPATAQHTRLVVFDSTNGAHPRGSLLQAADGKLYGMTNFGGAHNAGVLFSFDPASATYAKAMDFDGTNGGYPHYGSLVQAADGKLYGTGAFGGKYGGGVLFSFDPATSQYRNLVDFDGPNGERPYSCPILASDGKLYGMTIFGGTNGSGVLYSFDPATATYVTLLDFDGNNGKYPQGGLLQASDGRLYGMTTNGGTKDVGVIYSFDITTAAFIKLKDFDRSNGAYPPAGSSLIEYKPVKKDSLTFRAFLDGSEYVHIRGNRVWYVHRNYQLVGRSDGANFPTYVNGNAWYPKWPEDYQEGTTSSIYTALAPPLPTSGKPIIALDVVRAREALTLVQRPEAANGYETIILLDDDAPPGADWYEFRLKWQSDTTTVWYQDADGDGWGNPNSSKITQTPPRGYVANNLDCNDKNKLKGGPEVCDGLDNDCDGYIDNGFDKKTFYSDFDGDGYGTPKRVLMACAAPPRYVSNDGDCNDDNKNVYPGAPELCDGRDNDCDGTIDEGFEKTTFYHDFDKDGYGNPGVTKRACAAPLNYVAQAGDCNDRDRSIHPGAVGPPNDGIDNNCNGLIDEPLHNAITSKGQEVVGEQRSGLQLTASPNPATHTFTLRLQSTGHTPVQLRVVDALGRTVEVKQGLPVNTTLTIGHNYKPGMYYVDVIQGIETATLKLVKQAP